MRKNRDKTECKIENQNKNNQKVENILILDRTERESVDFLNF